MNLAFARNEGEQTGLVVIELPQIASLALYGLPQDRLILGWKMLNSKETV